MPPVDFIQEGYLETRLNLSAHKPMCMRYKRHSFSILNEKRNLVPLFIFVYRIIKEKLNL